MCLLQRVITPRSLKRRLASRGYSWTARTAILSKLCDWTDMSDPISSVSWMQKVRSFVRPAFPLLTRTRRDAPAVGMTSIRPRIYDAPILMHM